MKRKQTTYLTVAFLFALYPTNTSCGQANSERMPESGVLVEDFQLYEDGAIPRRWKFFTSTNEIRELEDFMADDERFFVVEEAGNRFVRAYTADEAQRISIANKAEFGLDWDLREHPALTWRWRANHLPVGAAENDENDSGGAIYVTFSRDWLGRPRSIKYVYSSTLPVGTVVSFGRLKVVVASSGADGIGSWVTVQRNVADDYQRVFEKSPPDRPLSITLWSDSDNTGDWAEVDYDDLAILK